MDVIKPDLNLMWGVFSNFKAFMEGNNSDKTLCSGVLPHCPSGCLAKTYCENSHQTPLQEASEHIAPVMFVVGHPGQTHVHSSRNQEELDGGTQQPRPLRPQSGLNVQLQ